VRAAIASKDFATRKKLVRGWLRASGESDFRVQLDHGISAVWAEGRPQPHRILAAPFSFASWPIGTAHRSAAPWYVLSYAAYNLLWDPACDRMYPDTGAFGHAAQGCGRPGQHGQTCGQARLGSLPRAPAFAKRPWRRWVVLETPSGRMGVKRGQDSEHPVTALA
jgi:hypothetical protein